MLREGRIPDPWVLVQALLAATGEQPIRLARPEEATYAGLVRAVRAQPEEATPRHAFADFLEEHGVPGHTIVRGHAERMDKDPGWKMPWFADGNRGHNLASPLVLLGPEPRIGGPGTTNQLDETTTPEEREHPMAQVLKSPRVPGVALAVQHRAEPQPEETLGVGEPLIHYVHIRNLADWKHHTASFPAWATKELKKFIGAKLNAKKAAPPPEQPERLARAETTPEHVVYVSPSTREGSTFEQARSNFNGPGVQALRAAAMSLPTVRKAEPAVGYWKDGAEETAVVHVGDPAHLPHVGRTLGDQFKQKAVLWFHEHPAGTDARHVIVVRESDPMKIHDDMARHGIEYKTLIPLPNGRTRIEAVDQGDSMRPEFEGYAREQGAETHQIRAGEATLAYTSGHHPPE